NSEIKFTKKKEMLEAITYLREEKEQEVVVTNTHKIKEKIDPEIAPVKSKLYTPKLEGAEEEIRTITYKKAKELYGETLPENVEARIERELDSIIGNGFAVIYLIYQKLVENSK